MIESLIDGEGYWIIATSIFVSILCSIPGCFLVLRKATMFSDAISHAVLPGIVIAFMFTGTLHSIWLIIGASLMGLLSAVLISFFTQKLRVQEDASIGIVYTFLFAIGLILIAGFVGNADLDQECVLYGELAFVPLDRWIWNNGWDVGPVAMYTTGFGALVISGILFLFKRPLQISTFDPVYSTAIGINIVFWNYVLMCLLSFASVISFEAVGAILVVAFVAIPSSTAYLLSNRFDKMIVLSIFFGTLASVIGYFVAAYFDASIAGAITVVLGVQFVIVFLFAPEQGIFSRIYRKKDTIKQSVIPEFRR